MTFKNNSNFNDSKLSNIIEFTVTENIEKLEIKEFAIQGKDIVITWSNGRSSCINFKSSSISENKKLIEKILRKEVKGIVDDETLDNAIRDIEDQLVKRREEIFSSYKTKTSDSDSVDKEFKSNFLEEVSKIRENFEKCANPFLEWQSKVAEKREILKSTTITYYPEAWSTLEFCLAVKTILNIDDNRLPFIGLILAKPSSLKTTITKLFEKYIHAFYSDSFSPNSFASHISGLTEEELRNKVDMLPKIKNKLFVTTELAPIFTAKEDDLRKVLGIITKLADGDGLKTDSGVHGHREYSATMFSWIGAIVEISPKVWEMLSLLGFKIYCFRPKLKEKTVDELAEIVGDNSLNSNNKRIEDALFDYLKIFDACPQSNNSRIDENGIVKIKWDAKLLELGNGNQKAEQESSKRFIAQIAKLLAPLRGTVNVYTSRSKINTRSKNKSSAADNSNNEDIFYQKEEIDYEIDTPIIEDPSRAAIALRNLSLANAISHGRNYLIKDDVRLIIQVAFSTTRIHRSKLINLLMESGGELTTSKIVNELKMSEPKARMTMREFEALGIGIISSVSAYANSELRIKLDNKFNWFLSEEFQKLINPVISREIVSCYNNKIYQSIIIKNINCNSSNNCSNIQSDNCHTLKANLPQREIKNNNIVAYDKNKTYNNFLNSQNSHSEKIEFNQQHEDINNEISKKIEFQNLQKNSLSLGPKTFQRVTASQENKYKKSGDIPENILNEVLDIIKKENGSISLGYALQLACQRSEVVKEYFKNEKLTARESRKVRNLFVEINRHPKMEIVKKKPQLVVKWIEQEKEEVIINN
jgi:hypothetical protein